MKKDKGSHVCNKRVPHLLVVILIFIIGLSVYYQSVLKGVFIFDDNGLIIENSLIKNFSFLKDIFTTHLFYGSGTYSNFYRPMQSLSFMLDYYFWGLNPFGYHLITVLIHILNAVAVYFLIYIISKRQHVALIAGLLFCVHTVLSILVNYVAGRADLLLTFFFLLAIILYILYRQIEANRYRIFLYLSSIICFILAILSKEQAIILPFVLLLYLKCLSKDMNYSRKKPPNLIWVFFIIAGAYVFLRSTVLDFAGERLSETTLAPIPLYNRLLTTSKVVMIYLRLLLVPTGLHMQWDIKPASSFSQDEVFLSVVALIIIAIFSYVLFRKSKLKFFFIAWFFITLAPYFNIYPLAYFMGESWLYIPSIGFFALMAIYLSDLKEKSKPWSLMVNIIVITALIFYGILTFKRADVWANPVKLYTEILKHSPNDSKARINLGVILAKGGLYDEAIEKYKEVSNLGTEDAGTHSNLGTVYANKKMYDLALKEFQRAVELNPRDHVAYMNIGVIYKKKGDFKKAMEKYKKALELNPNYPLVYNNIGTIYLEKGQYDEAISFYKKAIGLNPHEPVFYCNIGKAYKAKGMPQEARESFEKAFQLDSNNKEAIEGLKSLD